MKDVHTEHCCVRHGCKYINLDCTVMTKKAEQSYPCEDCPEDLELMERQLVSLIEDASEAIYAAGWYGGIEERLWEQGGIWHVLGEALGEWPTRSKATSYEISWVPLHEWKAMHP